MIQLNTGELDLVEHRIKIFPDGSWICNSGHGIHGKTSDDGISRWYDGEEMNDEWFANDYARRI